MYQGEWFSHMKSGAGLRRVLFPKRASRCQNRIASGEATTIDLRGILCWNCGGGSAVNLTRMSLIIEWMDCRKKKRHWCRLEERERPRVNGICCERAGHHLTHIVWRTCQKPLYKVKGPASSLGTRRLLVIGYWLLMLRLWTSLKTSYLKLGIGYCHLWLIIGT